MKIVISGGNTHIHADEGVRKDRERMARQLGLIAECVKSATLSEAEKVFRIWGSLHAAGLIKEPPDQQILISPDEDSIPF